jgi:hypothetical protein
MKSLKKRVLMEVTKRMKDINGDTKLRKKLVSTHVDDKFNERVSKEAIDWYEDLELWLQETKDPNLQLKPTWLKWTLKFMNRHWW